MIMSNIVYFNYWLNSIFVYIISIEMLEKFIEIINFLMFPTWQI